MEYAIFILEYLKSDYNKIITTKSVYTKLIRACSRKTLENYVNQLFSMMPQSFKINNPLYYSAFLNGLYDDFSQMKEKEKEKENINDKSDKAYKPYNSDKIKENSFKMKMDFNEKENHFYKRTDTYSSNYISNEYSSNLNQKRSIKNLINSSIFVPYNYCNFCFNNNKIKKINYCDVIAGFTRDSKSQHSTCNVCLNKYIPYLYIVFEDETKLENVEVIKMLSPTRLMKEIDEIIKQEGEKYFFLSDYYLQENGKEIFWNILFYFEIFGLPNIVMILHQDSQKLRIAVEDMMVGMQNAKRINDFRKTSNCYSSVQMQTLVTLTEKDNNDNNSENSGSDSSFKDEDDDAYCENEKILDEKM